MSARDRVVLISGGTSGIGAACAREFHALGANVAIIGRDRGKAEVVAEELKGASPVNIILGNVGEAAFCDAANGADYT